MKSAAKTKVCSSILLALPDADNRALLSSILQKSGHPTYLCGRCRDAVELLPFVSIVISEQFLPDGTWHDILLKSRRLPDPPSIIVTSRLAGVDLWREVLELGGFDLLAQPFHPTDVLWAVESADAHAAARRNRKNAPGQEARPAAAPKEAVLCLPRQ
jgi:DNA-binding NtrC family response regulator